MLFQRQPKLASVAASESESVRFMSPSQGFSLHLGPFKTFRVIPLPPCKAPTSGEKLGTLFLINVKCCECGTQPFLPFSISLSLY